MCIKIYAAHYYKLCAIHVTVCQYIVHIHTHTHTHFMQHLVRCSLGALDRTVGSAMDT